ncbi:MAG: hypothetical protein ACYC6Z_10140 [Thermoleophilia bacterium]
MQAEFDAKVTSDVAAVRALQAANASKFSDAGEAFTFLHELTPDGLKWTLTKSLKYGIRYAPYAAAIYDYLFNTDQAGLSVEAEQAQIKYFEMRNLSRCQYCPSKPLPDTP